MFQPSEMEFRKRYWSQGMAWAAPKYSRAQVDAAGRDFITTNVEIEKLIHSWEVINNWRSSHSLPLNTFQTALRVQTRSEPEGYDGGESYG